MRTLLLAVAAVLGGAGAAPVSMSSRTFHYICNGGKTISVSYVSYSANGPSFAVLNWNGQKYGLAQAASASGARYASLSGPTESGGGLQWWEWHGNAVLDTFVGTDTSKTRRLLVNCKVGR